MKNELNKIRESWSIELECLAPGVRRIRASAGAAALACVCLFTLLPLARGDNPFCNFYGTTCPDLRDRPPCEGCSCTPGSGGPSGNPGLWSGILGGQSSQSPGTGEANSTTLCGTCGLAKWWVSEPQINLRFEDEPIGYQPSRGQRMSFHLSYRQRGAIPEGDEIFGVGPQWSMSLRAFLIQVDDTLRLHRGGAGAIDYQAGVMQYLDGSILTATNGGYKIEYSNGSIDTFTTWFQGVSSGYYFLSARTDPAGNITTFSYADYNDAMQLQTVTDPDGNQLHLYYTNSTFTNLITLIQDDFSRTAVLQYDEAAYLTNITDVAGISGGFQYDSIPARRGWITNFTTRVGTSLFGSTGFEHRGQDAENNAITTSVTGPNRFIQVSLPDGSKELYVYRHDCTAVNIPTTYSTMPTIYYFGNGTLDNVDQNLRNSFKWGPLQYSGLSTTDVTNLTGDDYLQGRLYHWLKEASGDDPSTTLSLERAPSAEKQYPTLGQITWYDYEGKSANNRVGTNAMPSLVALVLPDSNTRFTRYTRNQRSLVTSETSTYTTWNGSVDLQTNYFHYAVANGIDLEQHVGPLGTQVSSNYFNPADPTHQPRITYDALNQATTYYYNSYGQVQQIERPSGLVTTNYYPTSGNSQYRLAQSIDVQISRTNAYTHYADGLLATHTDERGMTVTYSWDALQRLTGETFPDGTTRSNRYELLDVSATKDRLDQWTGFGYDSVRRKTAETNVNGVITRYGYCDCGGLRFLTNAWGSSDQQVVSFDYDNQGLRTFTHLPDDRTITNLFNSLGQLWITGDARGWRTNTYNNQGLLSKVDNVYGNEQSTLYDLEGRPWYVIDANGVAISSLLDALGRVYHRSYPDYGVEGFGYTARGLVAYTNQLGFVTRYFNDAAGRRMWETNANLEWIQYYYDSSGNLTNLVDGKGQSTKWGYDLYGRVTNKLDQAGVEILRYGYDPEGRLTNRWSKAKGTTVYSYDPVGNLTNINYPATTDVRFTFDALNRLKTMVDAAGTTAYAYSEGGQLWTENGPFDSDTVTNTYVNGLRTALALQQPSGTWTNGFGYDLAGRLTNVTSQAGSHGYLLGAMAAGSPLVKRLTLPNTSYITNTFDRVARFTSTYLRKNDGTVLNKHEYTYNTGGQRVQQIRTDDTYVDYFCDPIGQLTNADCSVATEDRGYFYDKGWNLRYRTNNGAVSIFTVDAKNQLLTAAGASCSYDGNGNLAQVNDGATTAYFYDDENQLVVITNGIGSAPPEPELAGGVRAPQMPQPTGGWKAEFVYDGQGRRRIRRDYYAHASGYFLTNTTWYVYDGKRVIQERNASNVPAVSYTRGTDLSGSLEGAGGIGGLLARSAGYSGGNWTEHVFYHADGNGNITYLVNSSQALAASYRYDPYGNLITKSGTLADANLYRFSSKEIHDRSGLYYYLYRFYSPSLQRWPNRDPIADVGFGTISQISRSSIGNLQTLGELENPNLFSVAANEPISHVDPFGDKLAPVCAACLICMSALAIDCVILCRNGTWDVKGEGFFSCMVKCATASPLYSATCGAICVACGISGPKPCPPPRPSAPPIPPRTNLPRPKYPTAK